MYFVETKALFVKRLRDTNKDFFSVIVRPIHSTKRFFIERTVRGTFGTAEEGDAVVSKTNCRFEITRKDIRCLYERRPMTKECMSKACSLINSRDQQIMLLTNHERKRSFFAVLDLDLSVRALNLAFDEGMGKVEDFYRLCFAYTDTNDQRWCCIVLETTTKLAVIYDPYCSEEANEGYLPYCSLVVNAFLRSRSTLQDSFIEWNSVFLKTYGEQQFETLEDSGVVIAISLYMISFDCPVYFTQATIEVFRENIIDWFLEANLPI
jgi:hypothetical protein